MQVKGFLSRRGVPFEERDVYENAEYRRELLELGFSSVPVTVVGGRVIPGFDPRRLEEALGG